MTISNARCLEAFYPSEARLTNFLGANGPRVLDRKQMPQTGPVSNQTPPPSWA